MSSNTEQAVYLQRIDPKYRDDYLEAHEDVPDDVIQAMEQGGVIEFELYVRDDLAVCILEAENIDAYQEAVNGDEAVERWERHVAQFKREGVDIDNEAEPIPFMKKIWTLSDSSTI